MENLDTIIALTSTFIGSAGLVGVWFSYKKHRANRELIEFTYQQVENLEGVVSGNKAEIDAVSQRVAEQTRRIAWLESRVRQSKPAKKDVLEETVLTETGSAAKANITERRHRVLSLAARGQNSEAIAATLGMLPGEVELIINLNRASFAQFS